MMKNLVILSSLLAAVAISCGSDSKTPDAKVFNDAPGSGSGSAMLTVKNAPVATPWCTITVGSGTASAAATQMVPITASGPITLKASPNAGFELIANMWHHTDGDTGTGDSGTVVGTTSTATVTVTAGTSKCVWVCCPFSPGGNGCPTTDQCP